ncbi:tail fiber domain-containing protein [Leptolyngbya sp. 7M]|uniref:tail fiber domain-containing protein n=1 Tax=Leptolyngbya sp. 7M TaxID=2812896 RepID=UPI001B8D43FB|nr:tail fiber domain-containing protein [Leptolyngbya sp. 7M]QYO66044.1 tail fiber domain-containing protein [Leptolyngbya sp. 7M]
MNRASKFLLIGILLTGAANLLSQTTAFTYQGRLDLNGAPATGTFDFEFLLFGSESGGTQIGSTVSRNGVSVANGMFSVSLDFGNQFPGSSRFIEIRVRPVGGGAYTTLSPRHPISSNPYAVRSLTAATAEAVTVGGIPSGSGNYIQNTNTQQPSSNFNISGNGTAGGTLSGNTVNAATQYNIGGNRVLSVSNIENTVVGINAGSSLTTSTGNTFFGHSAGQSTTNSSSNSFFGHRAGRLNTGTGNSFFGSTAGEANTTGGGNSFFGQSAGNSNTTANFNSFFGTAAGQANTTGTQNSFFGRHAGFTNVNGNENSYFGFEAGRNATSSFNSFFGSGSGRANTTGAANSFFGTTAGAGNTEGSDNAFFGVNTGILNTVGSGNSYFGRRAGREATGSNNTAVGIDAGRNNLTGSSNTFIGANADASATNLTFATAIGAGSTVSNSNTVSIGRGSDEVRVNGNLRVSFNARFPGTVFINLANTGNDGGEAVCWDTGSDRIMDCLSSIQYKTNIGTLTSGLDLITKLRPVSFEWIRSGKKSIGFIAEEVNEIEPRLATKSKENIVRGVDYFGMSAVLASAVKQQQEQIESLQLTVNEQKNRIDHLTEIICEIKPASKYCRND